MIIKNDKSSRACGTLFSLPNADRHQDFNHSVTHYYNLKDFRIMKILLLCLLFSSATTTLAEAVCSRPPPPAEQIPTAKDCLELVEDLFAISKLEEDEKLHWARNIPEAPGNRKLPFRFSTPSVNNNCEILVDTLKEDGGDTFSVLDVGLKAQSVVKACLEPGPSGLISVGAEVVGNTRSVAVFIVKKIPIPTQLNGDEREWTGTTSQTGLLLPLNGTSLYRALLRSSRA